MNFTMELKGMAELNRKLEGRIRRLEQRGLRESLPAFGEPIRAAAERYAHTTISPRLKYVLQMRMRGSSGTIKVGPSKETFDPSKSAVSHANIAFWFEFGYEIRHTIKGPSLAHVGARPTMTPAYLENKERGLAAFEEKISGFLMEDVP